MAEWRSKIPQMEYEVPLKVEVATKSSATRIKNGARRRSRVSEHGSNGFEPGRMRDGWKVRNADGQYAYEVYNEVPYVGFNEFGTVKMSAQPMLGPAVMDEEANYMVGIRAAFGV